ncbi:MAG: protein phosphatase 2C domain-containing protein [Clostridiales bacterium]
MNFFGFLSKRSIRKRIKIFSITNCGLVRKSNEDNFYTSGFVPSEINLNTKKNFTYKYEKDKYEFEVMAIFDGMGGMNAGEIASSTAAKEIRKKMKHVKRIADINELINKIQDYTKSANEIIHNEATDNSKYYGMGTTFVCLAIYDNKAVVLNTGDSRGYVYDHNTLKLLSKDHTIAAEHLRNNIITYEEAKNSKDNNKLTRFLGMSPEHGNMLNSVSEVVILEKGIRFILCSDGLYGLVEDEDILKVIKSGKIEKCAEKLVKKALENGGNDNVTITVVEIM